MSDCQQVVNEIRSFLQSSDMTLTDRFKRLTEEYAAECNATNQRLSRCEEFLAKGLRSEAIHAAQAEPPLLGIVATLDFPEWEEYSERLLLYSLPEPPRLQLSVAESLNRAYAEEQPLEELLRTHRRLALSRAPLTSRLQVLRQLTRLDKNNPVWADDLRQFETAFFGEVRATMAAPAKVDNHHLEEIATHFRRSDWITPPPAPLVKLVEQQSALRSRDRARELLQDVVDRLDAAAATGDVAETHALRDEYCGLLADAGLQADDPLVRRAAGPLSWLTSAEQQQARNLEFENAVAALTDALDQRADPHQLTFLRHRLLDLGRGVPDRVEQRYQEFVSHVRRALRWREYTVALAVLLGGLALLAGVIGFLHFRSKSQSSASAPASRAARPDDDRYHSYIAARQARRGENPNA